MTTAFILVINLLVAGAFALAFAFLATNDRRAIGPRWLAASCAMGVIDISFEFALYLGGHPTAFAVGIFIVFLAAITFCLVGVAHHYGVPPPRRALTTIWLASLAIIPVVFSLPYTSLVRALLYQAPYVVTQGLVCWIIIRTGRRQALDILLAAISALAALTYLAKPALGLLVDTASAAPGYMASTYAAVSQSSGAVTLVALMLVLLLVMMRDANARIQAESETDALSAVLNRRGFERHAARLLGLAQRANRPAAFVTADLDHFKGVNDCFGHAAGDEVIAHFAAALGAAAPADAIVGRMGGEEFAVLLPGADLPTGRRYAEVVRKALLDRPPAALRAAYHVTASFGLAGAGPRDSLSQLAKRADAALYRAKTGGRDRVCLATDGIGGSEEGEAAGWNVVPYPGAFAARPVRVTGAQPERPLSAGWRGSSKARELTDCASIHR